MSRTPQPQAQYRIDRDRLLPSHMAAEVSALRGRLLDLCERGDIPARFECAPCEKRAAVQITDTATGRHAVVPLCSYYEVRQALNRLFG
jgi:hypothetical protein